MSAEKNTIWKWIGSEVFIEDIKKEMDIRKRENQKNGEKLAFNNSIATVKTDGNRKYGQQQQNFGPIQCYSTVHLTDANDLFISQFIIHNSIINIYFFRCARRLCGRHSLNAMHSTSFVVVIVAVVSVCVCMAR